MIPFAEKLQTDIFSLLEEELFLALTLFWDTAGSILDNSGVKLQKPSFDYFALKNNFFSALFLYSYVQGKIPKSKRIYYAAMNQCLRGMVTGCDNILDDEYKKTLDTDLPANAHKFRSILDIMVSDRILTAIVHKGYQKKQFSFEHILSVNTASLHALLKSGAQEASEEKGINHILEPEKVLSSVHSIKTGILFQAPWVIPELTMDRNIPGLSKIKEGLFFLGMGCQILDDMVDMHMDAINHRHNYIISLVSHGENEKERQQIQDVLHNDTRTDLDKNLILNFPDACTNSGQKALALLEKGATLLFAPEHGFMIPYSIDFLVKRIGADSFLETKR